MSSLLIQEAAIFALVILFLSYETTCSPQNLKRQAIDTRLSPRSQFGSENNSTRFKRHINADDCCVKRRFYSNGRVSFECMSEHPDCFAKTNAWSSSFGLCVSIVNRKNIVIGCRCAAQKKRFSPETFCLEIQYVTFDADKKEVVFFPNSIKSSMYICLFSF